MTRAIAKTARNLLLRAWRLGALAAAAWLLHVAAERRETDSAHTRVPLQLAQHLFPTATRVGRPDRLAVQAVFDAGGRRIGAVLTTSPQTDDLIGYSGPNNLLVALAPDGRVAGMEFLSSGDTEAHVDAVRQARSFWRSFDRWLPVSEVPPAAATVSGSTLTSLAMAEAVQRRLAGVSVSLRFPEPPGLDEVRALFPTAAGLDPEPGREGRYRISDATGLLLGHAVRTAPHSDNVRGYGGPTESLAAVSADGRTVTGIRLRRSYDTPGYVDRVRADEDYLKQLAGRSVEDWAAMDFRKAGIEGVSGATQTSYAVAEGLRRRFVVDRAARQRDRPLAMMLSRPRDGALVAIVAGALLISFSSLRGGPRIRIAWQVVLVAGLGLWLGDLLSVALFAGWAQHGAAWRTAPALVLLAAAALLVPWATRRQIYCFHLCPHGAAQEWLAGMRRWPVKVPAGAHRWLRCGPGALLGIAFLLALLGWRGDLATLEPFDAWALKTGAAASAIIAILGLVAAWFVPLAYCHYGCPTGALLKFMRNTGSAERWGTRDGTALAFLALGALLVFLPPRPLREPSEATTPAGTRVGGTAFGTAWTVTTRASVANPGALRDRLQAELERIESTLSHWRPESVTSQFNSAETTRELVVPAELIALLQQAVKVSAASSGALDVTIAPLARALGFGPGADPQTIPDDQVLAAARERVGWTKLRIDPDRGTVMKTHPGLQVDLGALLQGYAADRLIGLLEEAGIHECLVDVGGELRAVGSWTGGVEDPRSPGTPLRRLELKDAALSTSGVYRGSLRDGAGVRRAHLIDPRSARPVEHRTVLVAVVAPLARDADAWATALLVLGGDEALRAAEREDLAVLVVQTDSDGRLALQETAGFQRLQDAVIHGNRGSSR